MSRIYRRPEVTLESLNERRLGSFVEKMNIDMVSLEEKKVIMRMKILPFHLAANGYLHAGSIVTLADTSCGFGAIAHLPDGAENFTTIELKSNHLGTLREGELHSVATAKHLGRNTHVWDAEVYDAETEKTIALFRCTQMILWPRD